MGFLVWSRARGSETVSFGAVKLGMSFDLEEAMLKYKRKQYFVKLRAQYMLPKGLKTSLGQPISPEGVRDKTAIAQVQMARIVEKVKTVLNVNGVLSDYHMMYTAYAHALDKSQRTLEFMVDRTREHAILRGRFEGYGCESAVLDKIDLILIWNNVSP